MGSTMGSHAEFQEIVRVLGQGGLRPTVDSSYPLDRGPEALKRLETGQQFGKVVVEI